MRQPGREFCGVISPKHAIASVEVAGHGTCVPGVVLEPSQGFLLATLERECCLHIVTDAGASNMVCLS